MKNGQRFGIMAVLTVLAGCGSNATVDSTDVNEDKVYQHYHTDYDAGAKSLAQFAQFTLGNGTGTTIRLTSSSTVKVDGTAMTLRDGDHNPINLIGTFYTQDSSTEAPKATYSFAWTRTNGKVFTNTVALATAVGIGVPAAGASLNRQQDIAITLTGDDASSEGSVTVSLVSASAPAGSPVTTVMKTITAGKSVIISQTDLVGFPVGSATLTAVRQTGGNAVEANPGVGGKVESSWRSAAISVSVAN